MKRTIHTFILFIGFTISLSAQITVTNTSFPTIGDTLRTAIDGAPQDIVITPSGENATWDFSSLQGVMNETIINDATTGVNADQFPAANLLFPAGINGEAGESYGLANDEFYALLGYVGADPVNLGLNVTVPFSPPIVQRRSPMNYQQANDSEYAILTAFSGDIIPAEVLDQLPIEPDSVRLKVSGTREDFVDAWGSLTIPGGTYEVLREKRIDIRETAIEAKVGFGPFAAWVDVTEFLGSDLLGADTTTSYVFVNDIEKEDIAVVTVTNDELETPLAVTYKANDVSTNVNYINTGRPDILAYPNPAIYKVRISFMNLNPGNYTFRIFNILGKEVVKEQYFINGNHTIGLGIDTLQKGTYLYSLTDSRGKVLSTKRLMVIRP